MSGIAPPKEGNAGSPLPGHDGPCVWGEVYERVNGERMQRCADIFCANVRRVEEPK